MVSQVIMGSCSRNYEQGCTGKYSDKSGTSSNPRKIMNDSLNMITKSRNKYLNKSYQQMIGMSGSSGRNAIKTGGATTSNADSSMKLGSTSNFN